jgi:23S rRNA (uracil1939-C5)-methyltransferase
MAFATLTENPDCNPACGACHYKDLDYSEGLARKQAWAESQLRRWAGVLRPIVAAPEAERIGYRAKSWLRTHREDGDISFGMFRAVRAETKWGKEFISWNTCPIHSPAIRETIARLRPMLAAAASSFAADSLFGVWFGTPHLVLIAKEGDLDVLRKLPWEGVLAAPIDAVWFHRTSQVGRTVFGENPVAPVFGETAKPGRPIRAFRQIAQTLLDEARAKTAAALLEVSPALVVDLYSGTGELARLLPANVGWLGIEAGKEAVAFANTLRPGAAAYHCAFLGLVEHRLRDSAVREKIAGNYALHINPPRPGLGTLGREILAPLLRERRPGRIAYLSCSASSLARDLVVLEKAGFRVESLEPFDFFPQTEHFETLAILR